MSEIKRNGQLCPYTKSLYFYNSNQFNRLLIHTIPYNKEHSSIFHCKKGTIFYKLVIHHQLFFLIAFLLTETICDSKIFAESQKGEGVVPLSP
ncbi:hypothetical protein J27TS8_26040 [Robertmurraya siralis]|uniref:Uncharacterized protein n=1 Tax=Robertmurraya siralis TaxID=77777 RepID=A0A919WJ08_9BACI|nr:hypothetical protein J27TS8_26040 [Robertmurraya siralis]